MFTGRPSPGDFVRRISRPGGAWLVVGGVLACVLAVVSYVVAHPGRPLINWYDFRVYWDGGLVARHSPGALYSWQFGPEVRFTYTPFAASLFALMSLMPWTVAKWLMTAGSLAALLATIGLTLRQLGWAGRRRLGAVLLVAAVAWHHQIPNVELGEGAHVAPELFKLCDGEDVFLALAPTLLHFFECDVGGHARGEIADGSGDDFGIVQVFDGEVEQREEFLDINPGCE